MRYLNQAYISKFFIAVILLGNSQHLIAQIKPNAATQPGTAAKALNPLPGAYTSGIALNYVRTYDASRALTTLSSVVSTARTVQEVKRSTQYVDGLGRSLQIVTKGISPNGYDMVAPVVYDEFGNESIKYVPYVSSGANGDFKTDPFTEQNTFMMSEYNPTNAATGEKFFYSKTEFESSTANATLRNFAPGNNWVGDSVGVQMQYLLNTAGDSVCIWKIDCNPGSVPVYAGYYGEGQLSETTTKDENGNQMVEYKDKKGDIILKKVQSVTGTGLYSGHTGWFCTYYVYDDFNNLRFVIQPKGTQSLKTNSWVFDNTVWKNSVISKELCFSYEYDRKGRTIIKRVPGAGEVWMVYDARDRLVMSQDSTMMTNGKWLYTNYDNHNRVIKTGLWTESNNRTYHQNLAETSISYPIPTVGANNEVLTETYTDSYSWVAGSGSGLRSTYFSNLNANTTYFYGASNTTFPYPQSLVADYAVTGMTTGTKVKVLGTASTYLYSVNFYDSKGRVIQLESTNNLGSRDTLTTQYSFSGQVLRTLVAHGISVNTNQNYRIATKNDYDAVGRVSKVYKKIGNSPQVTLAENLYSELGQLKQKKLGLTVDATNTSTYTYSANPLDRLNYVYNVRGWLRGINKDYARNENGANNWFGMELCYDYGFTAQQLNGNIAGIRWRNASDGQQRGYGFAYDVVNRLTKADFTQNVSGTTWDVSAGIDYSVHKVGYDANGNILTMYQMGVKLNTSLLIDSLVYGYTTNTNKLAYVTDKVNDTSAHLGDFTEINNNNSSDYLYNGNGSLTKDNNKAISSITYNYLNLPDEITVTGKGTIAYTYDASGNKLSKTVSDELSQISTITDYAGLFTYQFKMPYGATRDQTFSDTLQYIGTEEGRARAKSYGNRDTMYYDYFEKDHLGNVRVVLTDQLQQDVYPAATLESSSNTYATENNYYDINNADTISVNRIASWSSTTNKNYVNNNGNPPYNNNPDANTGAVSNFVYKLNGATGSKTGLGITLKVMAGDMVDIFGKSFWHSNGTNPNNNYLISSALTSFINAFAGTSTVAGAGKGATAAALNSSTATSGGLNNWVNNVPNPSLASVPKAYINWILLDEQFKPVNSGSSFDLISTTPDFVKSHQKNVSIIKSGYLYVYCSNESNIDVFFDNLQVVHTRGPLMETTDYYPFGLTMSKISSNAAGKLDNKYQFGSKEKQEREFSDDSGLEFYDYGSRVYDNQIGRWITIDPLSEIMLQWAPYCYGFNNPFRFTDETGMLPGDNVIGRTIVSKVVTQKIESKYVPNKTHSGEDALSGTDYITETNIVLTTTDVRYYDSENDNYYTEREKTTTTTTTTVAVNSEGQVGNISQTKSSITSVYNKEIRNWIDKDGSVSSAQYNESSILGDLKKAVEITKDMKAGGGPGPSQRLTDKQNDFLQKIGIPDLSIGTASQIASKTATNSAIGKVFFGGVAKVFWVIGAGSAAIQLGGGFRAKNTSYTFKNTYMKK